jgi:hypothetical protein
MISDIAELRELSREQRNWRRECDQRRMVLATKRVPVARKMQEMGNAMGVSIREGETLSAFVARVLENAKGVR